jgi:branched-subunit amino acid aminotransferase/4-amino-4-deoxychorismate lyase
MEATAVTGHRPDDLAALALTGYGHFTTMRVEDRAVRGLSRHLDRLVRDCREVFGAELDPDRVRRELREALTDAPDPVVVRVTVFDPALNLVRPAAPAAPHLLVTTRPASPLPFAPLRVAPVTHRRQTPRIKHVGLFDSLHLRRAAQLDGHDDCLFVTDRGEICEGATWNIGFYDGDRVVWPTGPQLPGVTMALLQDGLEGRTVRRPVTMAELPDMEAAFATNSAVGVRPVSAVGPVGFPPDHPVMADLRARYAAVTPEVVR